MKAADIMTTEVATCRTTETVNRAAQLMWEGRCGCVPVVDHMETVVGMLTDRDVCMASYTQGKALSDIPVTAAMTRMGVTCYPSTSVDDIREMMAVHRIRRVPVVDGDGRLMGLVSLTDIARAAATWDARSDIHLDDVALTLAEVTDHWGDLPHSDEEPTPSVREAIRNSAEVLKTLRQEIQVDLNLAGREIRGRWKRLQARLATAEARARAARDESSRSLQSLVDSAKRFRSALKESRSRAA